MTNGPDTRTSTDTGEAGADSYHHGNLREAMLDVAVARAREGGTDAIVVRDLTRRAGVTPRAAYRHFANRQAVVEAVAVVAFHELADRIRDRLAGQDIPTDPASAARARLRTIGREYVAWARAEPGLFEVAFFARERMADHDAVEAVDGRATAYGLLTEAVDHLDAAGALTVPAPTAVLACWSAVHGLATLAVRGPLRQLDDDQVAAATAGVVAAAVAGVVRRDGPD